MPLKFQSDTVFLSHNLAASRLHIVTLAETLSGRDNDFCSKATRDLVINLHYIIQEEFSLAHAKVYILRKKWPIPSEMQKRHPLYPCD